MGAALSGTGPTLRSFYLQPSFVFSNRPPPTCGFNPRPEPPPFPFPSRHPARLGPFTPPRRLLLLPCNLWPWICRPHRRFKLVFVSCLSCCCLGRTQGSYVLQRISPETVKVCSEHVRGTDADGPGFVSAVVLQSDSSVTNGFAMTSLPSSGLMSTRRVPRATTNPNDRVDSFPSSSRRDLAQVLPWSRVMGTKHSSNATHLERPPSRHPTPGS